MTDLRKAAEAVLEAWAWDWSEPRNKALRERMGALRQALSQEWVCCVCGEPEALGIVHSADAPCFHYTKREWVGLTDEEVNALLWKLSLGAVDEDVRTIEAKLKEKNGGNQ